MNFTPIPLMLIMCSQGSFHFINCDLVQNYIVQQLSGGSDHIEHQLDIHIFPSLWLMRMGVWLLGGMSYKPSGVTSEETNVQMGRESHLI